MDEFKPFENNLILKLSDHSFKNILNIALLIKINSSNFKYSKKVLNFYGSYGISINEGIEIGQDNSISHNKHTPYTHINKAI